MSEQTPTHAQAADQLAAVLAMLAEREARADKLCTLRSNQAHAAEARHEAPEFIRELAHAYDEAVAAWAEAHHARKAAQAITGASPG